MNYVKHNYLHYVTEKKTLNIHHINSTFPYSFNQNMLFVKQTYRTLAWDLKKQTDRQTLYYFSAGTRDQDSAKQWTSISQSSIFTDLLLVSIYDRLPNLVLMDVIILT